MKKFGKILPVLGSVAFAIGLVACGDDGSNAVAGKKSDDVTKYATIDDLPNCTANRDGVIGLVEEDDSAYVCRNAKWESVGEVFNSEDDFPNCTPNRENGQAYAKNEHQIFVCHDGRWSNSSSSSSAKPGTNNDDKPVSSSSSKKDESKSSSSDSIESSSSVATQSISSVQSSSSFVLPPIVLSSSSYTFYFMSSSSGNVCGDIWCGLTDTLGIVEAGELVKDSSGKWTKKEFFSKWFKYDDKEDKGTSSIVFPDGYDPDEHGGSFGPLIKANGGIKASVVFGDGWDFPYAGLAFHVADVDGYTEVADLTTWGGVCVVYQSDISFQIELVVKNEASVTERNNFMASVVRSDRMTSVHLGWDKFKQESGWGRKVSQSEVLTQMQTIRLKFWGKAGTSGNFVIQSIGMYGNCN